MIKESYNAGDEIQVKERKTKAQLENEKRNEELKQLLEKRSFRDFIWRTLANCGIYLEAFTGNSHTFYNEGKRAIGVKLITEICQASPKAYALMQLENLEGDK